MNENKLYSIGDLSRRSGLAVRTIRFYSDAGLVPESGRSAAGYRLYDVDAVLRWIWFARCARWVCRWTRSGPC